ncbi:MAG: extracellular solute-binding protein [Candidatus Omnitrophica bacterium]|nr:extracellular solute-binding protein [Candidatus Omnitrophota bacterium]MBU1047785.1 extracellular solute-binding protein [Candidatus Omnitrophota bacterium]MBU1631047.1 extracellular solute-binding protein [Candidatus Omnitrophota bacterium]MBU1766553.1 extracellular solute-binding protein [Candidatus Omnitrophota bacterium]MBU1889314.1 extracellular solute-binding protein [Candidatus Omnitrophota bacterium]
MKKILLWILVVSMIVVFSMVGYLIRYKTPAVEEAPAENPVTIKVWEQMEPAAQKVFDAVQADFEAEYPLITIKRTHYATEDLRTNYLNSAIASGGPDIVYGPSDNIGIFLTADVIQAVTGIVSDEFLAKIAANALADGEVNGKNWSIPDIHGNQIALLYNKAYVQEAPATWEELVEVATATQDVDNGLYGFMYNEKEPYWFVGFFNGYGGDVMDDENNPTLDNEAMVKALQFALDIREVDGVGVEGMDYDTTDAAFKEGNAVFILNGAWSWTSYTDAGIDLGIAPGPVLPGGNNMTFYASTKGYSVSKDVDLTDVDKVNALKLFFDFFVGTAENNAKFALANSQAPTNKAALELDEIKSNVLQQATISTIQNTVPMPIVAETRGIWDAIRPELEAVIYSGKDPAKAATAMQKRAEEAIATIRVKVPAEK